MAHRQAPQIAPWFLGVHTWTRQKCSAGISRTERPTMNTSSASEKRFSIGCMSRILCRFVVMLVCALSLVAPVASRGAELKEDPENLGHVPPGGKLADGLSPGPLSLGRRRARPPAACSRG